MPSREITSGEIWETRCFGGPLHGQWTDTRERDVSFAATVQASHPLQRMERELQTLNRALAIMTCNYAVVTNTMADGYGSFRRIRCAIADGISRDELIEYRDYLHAELDRFREESYRHNRR